MSTESALPDHPTTDGASDDGPEVRSHQDFGPADLCVVVCTYNGAQRIGACLAALMAQETSVEIVVVDDGSHDGVAEVAAAFDVTVEVLSENQGLSAARNHGIRVTSSALVAFCDDDCVPPPDWTTQLLATWNQVGAEVVGVGGEVIGAGRSTLAERYLDDNNPIAPLEFAMIDPSLSHRLMRQVRQGAPKGLVNPASTAYAPVASLVGANMSFRRDALDVIGGFDDSIRFGGDEEYVCTELRGAFSSTCLMVAPKIVMRHKFDPHLRDNWRRRYSYGKGSGRRWVREGGLPATSVLGVTAAGAAVLAAPLGAAWAIGACLGVGLLPRSGWVSRAVRSGEWSQAAYPVCAMVDDACDVAGFFVGAVRQIESRRRPAP